MDVLLVQFVPPCAGEPLARFDHSLGVAAALMRQEGYSAHLVTVAGRESAPLQRAVAQHRPRRAVVDIDPCCVTAARRTIDELARTYALPVAVVGRYATCQPEQALSIPGAAALILGEYERALLGLLAAWRDGRDIAGLPGVWTNTEDGLGRGELPELLADLDALPFADRELFGYGRIVQATEELHFKAGRGCPQWCAYCVNDWYMDIHAGRGQFVRRRGVEHLLAEIEAVAAAYPQGRRVRFYDHAFIDDVDWLAAFSDAYRGRFALPIVCHVRPNRLDPQRAALLAAAGCESVIVPVISGSHFIRDEIFDLQTNDEHIDTAFRLLRQAGIAATAEVFVGSPYESEITVEETIHRLRGLAADDIHVEVYYPTPGTRSAELCRENGWLTGHGEEHRHKRQSVLDMPSLSARQINELAVSLAYDVAHPRNSRLMQLLGGIRVSRKRSLYDLVWRNGRKP